MKIAQPSLTLGIGQAPFTALKTEVPRLGICYEVKIRDFVLTRRVILLLLKE